MPPITHRRPGKIEIILSGNMLKRMLGKEIVPSNLSKPPIGARGLVLKHTFTNSDPKFVIQVGRLCLKEDSTFVIEFHEIVNGEPVKWIDDIPLTEGVKGAEHLIYDNTAEFDLAFFPQAEVISMLNYSRDNNNNNSDDEGELLITRGLVSIPHISAIQNGQPSYTMGHYRTLVARPFPDPVNVTTALSEDQALSLILAPPCPPIWREEEDQEDLISALAKAAQDQGFPITWGELYKIRPTKKLGIAFGEFFKSIGNSLFGKKDVKRR